MPIPTITRIITIPEPIPPEEEEFARLVPTADPATLLQKFPKLLEEDEPLDEEAHADDEELDPPCPPQARAKAAHGKARISPSMSILERFRILMAIKG